MTISMELSGESIRKAAEELKKLADRLRNSEDVISGRLAEIAAQEAQTHFSGVDVRAEGSSVVASGRSVVFQEFGAGARISDPYPDGADVNFEIRRGAYSDLHEGEYTQSGYESWHFGGREYRYVTPRNGLFHGMMAAREAAPGVVKEVLEGS